MRERAVTVFPFVLAAILPLAGVVMAGFQYSEGERDFAWRLAVASLLGIVIWALLLTA